MQDAFLHEALESWAHYKETRLHVTMEEISDDWAWGTNDEKPHQSHTYNADGHHNNRIVLPHRPHDHEFHGRSTRTGPLPTVGTYGQTSPSVTVSFISYP